MMSRFFKDRIRNHGLVLMIGVMVGLIYILPHIFFVVSLGGRYEGIPMMHTANEDFYLARIQEVVDGRPLLGSPAFYEYKDQPPLSPPVSEILYALPSLVFGVPPADTLVAS